LTDRKKFLLRLPPRLHEELKAWAAQEMRSLNGQVEYLLREAVIRRRKAAARELEDEGRAPPDGVEEPG
jgi:hypothetical protein